MRDKEESAQALFERINRRRGTLEVEIASAIGSSPVSPTVPTRTQSAPVSPPVPQTASASSAASSVPWSAAQATAGARRPMDEQPLRIDELLYPSLHTQRDTDTFPRSATMRFILKNPALALGVGLPAAALVLRSSGTRRMLQLALDVGTRSSVREAIGLSAATVRLMQTRDRSSASTADLRSGATQKKTP